VRTLIILLVVFAVAEPYGEQLLAGGSATPAHKLLVIDGSYSMAYRPNGNTNFALAKQMAIEMVHASHSGDVFTVILMSSQPKVLVGTEVFDHAAAIKQIESLVQPQSGADLPGTIALIRESLDDKAGRNLPPRKEVSFFTDLQRTTWGQVAAKNESDQKENSAAIAAQLESIASRAQMSVVDLGRPQASNLAVTDFSTTDAVVTSGREIQFDATLHNFGAEPKSKCNVEFFVDDVPVGEQTVDIASGSDAQVRFAHRFQAPGSHALTVRAASDRLELDNTRSFAVPVRGEVRALCVAGREGAAKYVADALNPNPTGPSPIRPIVIGEGDLAETVLTNFDCIFLSNVAQLTAGEAERLARYVKAGGGVVAFLGDRVVASSYNAVESIFPARIGDVIAGPQFGLDPLDYRHEIVAPFRGRERAGLLTTPVNRHYRLDVSQSRSGAVVAAAMKNGDPFIVTTSSGRGRVVMIATDGSLSSVDLNSGEPWTTWPTWPSFLPIVRELLAYATGGQHDRLHQLVGTPLKGTVADASTGSTGVSNLQMVRPDGRTVPVALESTSTGFEWTYADTNVSGIYSLRGLPKDEPQQFAVNVDTSESDLAKVDSAKLPKELEIRSTWQSETHAEGVASVSQASLNAPLLWTVLALLFVESFMAWQFGRGAL
jgi:von Willebrand factor type A domain/CARDB